jgi:signal peptidase I
MTVVAAVAGTIVVIGLLIVVAVLARRLVVVTVRGPSMEPTYHDGDRLLVHRDLPARPGQVVVVERSRHDPRCSGTRGGGSNWIIKRVAACPGDRVPRGTVPALANRSEDRVPPGQLVLLGDNQAASIDSRQLGYFAQNRTLGTVIRALGTERPER